MEIETTLFRFDKERNNKAVVIKVEYGTDRNGEKDWTINCDNLNVIAHSSGGWGIGELTLEQKEKRGIDWFKKMLNEDGFFNIEVERYESNNKVV